MAKIDRLIFFISSNTRSRKPNRSQMCVHDSIYTTSRAEQYSVEPQGISSQNLIVSRLGSLSEPYIFVAPWQVAQFHFTRQDEDDQLRRHDTSSDRLIQIRTVKFRRWIYDIYMPKDR